MVREFGREYGAKYLGREMLQDMAGKRGLSRSRVQGKHGADFLPSFLSHFIA